MTRFHCIRRATPSVLVALLVFASTSCSNRPGSVKGKITVNGKPIVRGTITFLPQSGDMNPINAGIIDGVFDSGPIPAGLAKIYIVQTSAPPEETMDKGDLTPVAKKARVADPNAVPTKYQSAETSGLTITVKSGEAMTFDKDLTP